MKRISTSRPVSPRQHYRSRRRFLSAAPAARTTLTTLLLVAAGCAHSHATSSAVRIAALEATCNPPPGWRVDRADQTDRYVQRVWVSPTGRTSYGVIHFTLPLPLGERIALAGFLAEMKRSEGEAHLISKTPLNRGLAFVAEGGRYRVNGIIVTHGVRGWAVYTGTLRYETVALDEIPLAVHARDSTIPDSGAGTGTGY